MKLFFFTMMVLSTTVFAQNQHTLDSCKTFLDQVMKDRSVTAGTYEVPLDYSVQNSPKIKIFYWQRKGTDSTKVPILLIHGGPGGNSWRYYQTFKDSAYAGDIISIDNRNEGCSHVKAYDDAPLAYKYFRARNVVKDLEVLRRSLYGMNRQWRIFGQSRGGPIAHYYLEMYPQGLESVQTHGFAMMTPEHTLNYTFMRSHFNARASGLFAQKFPEAADVIVKAKAYFAQNRVCLPMNLGMMDLPVEKQPKVCGALITDSLSYKLSNYAKWNVIAADLLKNKNPDGSLDPQKLVTSFQNEINGNIYVQYMNYIMGTNGMDVGSPAPRNFDAINRDQVLNNSLISEGRFVANAVYPAYLSLGNPAMLGEADPFNFAKVKNYLSQYERTTGRKFNLILFSSLYDTVAGPELYQDEKQILGPYVDVRPLNQSGHEGWGTEPELLQILFR